MKITNLTQRTLYLDYFSFRTNIFNCINPIMKVCGKKGKGNSFIENKNRIKYKSKYVRKISKNALKLDITRD